MRDVAWGVTFGCWLILGTICVQAQGPVAAVVVEKENAVEMQLNRRKWEPASSGSPLADRDKLRTGESSRAAVRFADLSILRVDELSHIEILTAAAKPALDVKSGGIYLLDRDRPQSIEIRTAAANAAIRGTEFALRVTPGGRTLITMFEGEVEMSNPQGRILLRSGEQGVAEKGSAPRKTAVIDAINTIQWCLYYPAVLDPAEFGAALSTQSATSLTAYRRGDLLGALRTLPVPLAGEGPQTRLLRAATILSVGQVEKARRVLAGVPRSAAGVRALERMIDAVQHRENKHAPPPITSSEWLAESYYLQSRHDLAGALASARRATEISPDFGLAWAHLAEIEFSFGRTARAMQLVERSLELAPRNAQAVALQGFLLAAENRTGAAHRSFEQAIALDGALGNAWLGRGLTAIRQGREQEGRRDLQIAATLEPTRAFLRSYLGKAFSDAGPVAKATAEFNRAKALDPADPIPWLYSALELQRQNRPNEAIAELERSIALNDQRRLYRSQFLLDQDRAIRGANLASIYRQAGMIEQSLREAIHAVAADYASAPAHLFLASSYDALRDPDRILLRHETSWLNELLISHLLSPVGSGNLSQFVSQQEYSKLFEQEGPHLTLTGEYRSDGILRALGSQYGTVGNLSYALDAEYYYQDGVRPNNSLSRFESYATFKLQVTPQDTVFLQAKFGDLDSKNVFQYYDPREASRDFFTERVDGKLLRTNFPDVSGLTWGYRQKQTPGSALLAWHHEWSPRSHLVLLLDRLASDVSLSDDDYPVWFVSRNVTPFTPPGFDNEVGFTIPRDAAFRRQMAAIAGRGKIVDLDTGIFDLNYHSHFQNYGGEIQQIWTLDSHTIIAGGSYHWGTFRFNLRLTDYANGTAVFDGPLFPSPPADQHFSVDFERVKLYLYDTWKVTPWLAITGGLTYDRVKYPEGFRSFPLNDRQGEKEKLLPKAGLTLWPWEGGVVRAAYSESLSGVTFDESVRLEPAQIAGYPITFRALASESLVGSVSAAEFQIAAISFEQKFSTHTYLGFSFEHRTQDFDRSVGAFDDLIHNDTTVAYTPSALEERNRYREGEWTVFANQLVGERWALGLRYHRTEASLESQRVRLGHGTEIDDNPDPVDRIARNGRTQAKSTLHELGLYALYQHPGGFFARADARWYQQSNHQLQTRGDLLFPDDELRRKAVRQTRDVGVDGGDFWQFDLVAGWRLARNRAELSVGILNATGEDYLLNPLNPYAELPRDRTFVLRYRIEF